MASLDVSSWPPAFGDKQLEELALEASTYALAHGLLYRPVADAQPKVPESAIHAPISLSPSPIPRRLFKLAQDIQPLYNTLYSRIAVNYAFLDEVMGAETGVGRVDDFIAALWQGWYELRQQGKIVQPLHLGLFRSDYLLHGTESDLGLKQVEFNTISSSFGALSERTAAMHRHLHDHNAFFGHTLSDSFPSNETTRDLVVGIAAAHKAYNVPGTKVLFVIQPDERNVFDQRHLEYELLERYSIHVIRQTFDQLATSAIVSEDTHRRLTIHGFEISVIYFRAGYTPNDYPTPKEYNTRFTLESSLAIKCPTIPLQLAGGKKIQQYLTLPGVLEKFLPEVTLDEISSIRSSWMGMWSLDEEGGIDRALASHLNLVLKPQREGGGNNVYKSSIPGFLSTLSSQERAAWIAMELIQPPGHQKGYLLRAGSGQVVETDVISELGIFGWSLFEQGKVKQGLAGWLVRTKGTDSDEGGVATGFSVLDSVLLVNE